MRFNSRYDPPHTVEVAVSAACVAVNILWLAWQVQRQRRRRRSAEAAFGSAAEVIRQSPDEARVRRMTTALLKDGGGKNSEHSTGVSGNLEANAILHMSTTKAAVKGLLLPYEVFLVLGKRAASPFHVRLVFVFLSAIFIAVIGVLLAPVSTFVTSAAIGLAISCIGLVLLVEMQMLKHDNLWREIPEFLDHRTARANIDNSLSVASLVFSFLQLAALSMKLFRRPTPERSNTSYELVKRSLTHIAGLTLCDFSFVYGERFSFGVAYGQACVAMLCVFIWWMLYGGIAYKVFSLAKPAHTIDGLAKHNAVRKSIYERLASRKIYLRCFMFMSDAMPPTVVAGLVGILDCWSDETGRHRLEMDPSIFCFHGGHAVASLVAVVATAYYVVAVVLVQPFLVGDSEGKFMSKNLDVRYEPLFLAEARLLKCASSIAAVYWSQYRTISRNLNFTIAVYLSYRMFSAEPSTIPWVNAVQTAFFQGSSVVALCVMFDANTNVDWWPLIVMALCLCIVGSYAYRCVRRGLRAPSLILGPMSGSIEKDSTWFSDVSVLRGMQMRLSVIQVSHNDKWILGLQFVYEIDGIIVAGPRHRGSLRGEGHCDNGGRGIISKTINLDVGEYIVALHSTGRSAGAPQTLLAGDPRCSLALATNKGKRWSHNCDPPGNLDEWVLKALPGQVLGLHGARNGSLHAIGFILLEHVSDHVSGRGRE